jgi:hypothetical protein
MEETSMSGDESGTDKDRGGTSRRAVMGGLSAGLAGSFGLVAAAQPASQAQPEETAPELRNPVTEYPHPPFPHQQQDPPGLASLMTPSRSRTRASG